MYKNIADTLNGFINNAQWTDTLSDDFENYIVMPLINLFENNPDFNAEEFWEDCFR